LNFTYQITVFLYEYNLYNLLPLEIVQYQKICSVFISSASTGNFMNLGRRRAIALDTRWTILWELVLLTPEKFAADNKWLPVALKP